MIASVVLCFAFCFALLFLLDRFRRRQEEAPVHPINLNTANSDQLQEVPGIVSDGGQNSEDAQTYGAFKSVEICAQSRASAQSAWKKMRKYLTVAKLSTKPDSKTSAKTPPLLQSPRRSSHGIGRLVDVEVLRHLCGCPQDDNARRCDLCRAHVPERFVFVRKIIGVDEWLFLPMFRDLVGDGDAVAFGGRRLFWGGWFRTRMSRRQDRSGFWAPMPDSCWMRRWRAGRGRAGRAREREFVGASQFSSG